MLAIAVRRQLGILLALSLPATAPAACPDGNALTVGAVSVTTPVSYDPFSLTGIRHRATATVRNLADTACDNVRLKFVQTADTGQMSGTGGADRLAYRITAPGGATQLVVSAPETTEGLTIGTLAADGVADVSFDLVINGAASDDDIVAPGSYRALGELQVSSDDLTGTQATATYSVATDVEELLDINIGGASYVPGTMSAHTMDFGTLVTGESAQVAITIRSNVDHRLAITSENAGAMIGPEPLDTHLVPYTVDFATLSGASIGSGQSLSLGGKTGLGGDGRSFTVRIGDVSAARAGTYRDTITLTVEAGF